METFEPCVTGGFVLQGCSNDAIPVGLIYRVGISDNDNVTNPAYPM